MFKATALLPTVALLISLAACGTTPTPATPAADASTDQEATQTEPALAAQSLRALPVHYRVRYVIDTVQSTNTEDVAGADEFYTLGTVAVRKPDGTKVSRPFVFAPPLDVNDHNGEIHQLDYVMFDEVVPANSDLFGQLAAYDEDNSKNWNSVTAVVLAKANIAAGIATQNSPTSSGEVFATTVVAAATGGLSLFMGADQDDLLGNMGLMSLTANSTKSSASTLHMFKNGSWYSDWNYFIKYHVEITATTNALTL